MLLETAKEIIDAPLSLRTDDKLELIRAKARDILRKAYTRYATNYNLRSRPLTYYVAQTVFKRSLMAASEFEKALVVAKHGSGCYELKDLEGKKFIFGIFYDKPLRT
uniref:Uncharacterized protein n=1 Tax=Glossina austeni TaxID=7395 RepID=A0A1A9UPQ4_GLOAU